MGPITIFDKSFLQSLTVDESVWYDNFFMSNVCPMFFVETLADLGKRTKSGRSPEDEVRIIAEKFPELHDSPGVQHGNACLAELMGQKIPMTGQILLAGGRAVRSGDRTGVVYEESPEAMALDRWRRGKFLEVERLYAAAWRKSVSSLDLKEMAERFRKLGIDGKNCKSLVDAKTLAEQIVSLTDQPFDRLYLALLFLDIPREHHREILTRWSLMNYPALRKYAPYVAFVYTVELFFQIALAAHLISTERPSNRVDISYLFYLPFCMVFVSSDRLHRKCAPLFMREKQQFIWGPDLKAGLAALNEHYSKLPNEILEKGIMSFASDPPRDGDFFVSKIWDHHSPKWREREEVDLSNPNIKHDELSAQLREMMDAPEVPPDEIDFDISDPDSISIKRSVHKKKGSWYQVPKDMEPKD